MFLLLKYSLKVLILYILYKKSHPRDEAHENSKGHEMMKMF